MVAVVTDRRTQYILCQAEKCCAIITGRGLAELRDLASLYDWLYIRGGKFLCANHKDQIVLLKTN